LVFNFILMDQDSLHETINDVCKRLSILTGQQNPNLTGFFDASDNGSVLKVYTGIQAMLINVTTITIIPDNGSIINLGVIFSLNHDAKTYTMTVQQSVGYLNAYYIRAGIFKAALDFSSKIEDIFGIISYEDISNLAVISPKLAVISAQNYYWYYLTQLDKFQCHYNFTVVSKRDFTTDQYPVSINLTSFYRN